MMTNRTTIAGTALALAFTLTAASAALAAETTYEVDKKHSNVLFKIRHMLSKTAGQFGDFSGTVTIDPDKRDTVKVAGTIAVASIDTDEPDRDAHLLKPDFFDAATHPTITFAADKLTNVNADKTKGKLEGTLTMRGVTKPIVLDVEWFGTVIDPWGNSKAAFSGTTKLNRKDYGISFNKVLDSGGYLVGDEVEIEINVEAQIPKPK